MGWTWAHGFLMLTFPSPHGAKGKHMAIKTRDLTTDWRRGDAEKLATLINEAGEAWPGGAWDPETPEEVERHHRESRRLGIFVAEETGRFVAFCDVYAKPEERNRAYVPFLTAHPDYHGKGYGKAVLHRSIARVYDLGIARVDLHTWPGNLKAVPLYKKTGFMWSPDEPWGVLMQNFTPGARRHPAAQAYFEKHDWYRTLKRDLSLTADDHKRGKVRIYPYEWEEGGDRLRMVYDRQSWGLLEFENNDFLVGCWLDDEKLVAGLPQRIRWQIVSHTGETLEVALIASGDQGVTLDRKEFLQVRGRADLEAEFQISPEIPEKDKEPRAPVLRTDLLINGLPITLTAGFEVKQAVSFGLDAEAVGLRPGRAEQVRLQVWSDLEKPAEAKVRLTGSAGVTLGMTETTVLLPAKGSAEVPLPITVADSGVVEVKAESEVKVGKLTIKPKGATLTAFALAAGDVVGHVEKDRVVLESSALRVCVWRRGGWGNVHDKIHNRRVAEFGAPFVLPPLAWDEFFDTRCDARIEREGERVTAVLGTTSIHRPGLRLERRLTLSNLPLIELHETVINGTASTVTGRIQVGARFRVNGGALVAPTAKGLVRGLSSTAGREFSEHNLSDKGADWPEGWMAEEDHERVVVGLLWDQAEKVKLEGWGKAFERPFPALAPGQSAALPPTHLFAGEGDALTVRRWWQMLYGDRQDREQRALVTRPPLAFGLRPTPLVVHGSRAAAKLVVDSVGRLELDGALTVAPCEGLRVQPHALRFEKVSGEKLASVPVTVAKRAGLPEGAYLVDCTVRLDRAIYHERQPVLVLGDPSKRVTVTKAGEHLRVDNGTLALTIAPEFQGCAISLARDGEQLLCSAYPDARPLAWMNPWHGGIAPELQSLGRDLMHERFTAREIERRGSQGVIWRGVRVRCSPKQDRGRHDKLELDYLLAPGSGILALALRTTRRTDTAGWLGADLGLWPILGGSCLDAVITSSEDDRAALLRTEFGRGVGARRWIIAENPKAKQAVVFAGCHPESWLGGHVFGRDGYLLSGGRAAHQEARETRESVFFVAYPEAASARELAEALSKLSALP